MKKIDVLTFKSLRMLVVLFVTLLGTMSAWAETVSDVKYMAYDALNNTFYDASCPEATVVESELTSWGTDGKTTWYVVNGFVSITDRIVIHGSVNLILADDYSLIAGMGITTTGASLHIYGQSNGTGTLKAGYNVKNFGAGIGGNYKGESGGNLYIWGGRIYALGGDAYYPEGSNTLLCGAGIGGGYEGNGGNIYIRGGEVSATGVMNSAGIGGGPYGDGGHITIDGGIVFAKNGSNAAAIGGGRNGKGGTININGGIVEAQNKNDAEYGIGAGWNKKSATINLSHSSASDNIYSPIYKGTVNLMSNFFDTDGNFYPAAKETSANLAGKKLIPAYEITLPTGVTATGATVNNGKYYAKNGTTITLSGGTMPTGCSSFGYTVNGEAISGNTFTVDSDATVGVIYTVDYILADGTSAEQSGVSLLSSSSTTLSEGWYAVSDNVTVRDCIKCNGTVNLILIDGCTLTVSKGITTNNASLIIYAQSDGDNMGTLTATGEFHAPCIGCTEGETNCSIVINGGKVVANHSSNGPGIGWYGSTGSTRTVTINGGNVTAKGASAAGIGSGYGSSGGTITINGGTVSAKGDRYTAAIGGGQNSDGGTIIITGGKISASSFSEGYDIGAGKGSSTATISLSYSSASDYIKTNYDSNSPITACYNGSVSIAEGKKFTDGTNTYDSNTTSETFTAMKSYKKLVPVTCTVSFDLNGAEGSIDSQTVLYGDVATEPDVPTLAGYEFKGWFLGDAAFDFSNAVTDDIELKAVWFKPLLGSGTETSPYIISNEDDWGIFVYMINTEGQSGKYFQLANDFNATVTTMVGTEAHPFSGTFDGNNRTLNVNLSSTTTATAPFLYISGATIKDLTVTGTSNGARHSAGLVAFSAGSNSEPNLIKDCIVSTAVTTPDYGGGIVGHGKTSTLTLEHTLFNGSISSSGGFVGGLMGWSDGNTLNIDHCLFDGTCGNQQNFHPIAFSYNANGMSGNTETAYYYKVAPKVSDNTKVFCSGKQVYTINLTDNDIEASPLAVSFLGKSYYESGQTISLNYTGNKRFIGFTVTDADGNDVEVTETDGTFSFNLQDDATVTLSGVVNTWKSGACDLTLYEDGMMEVTGSGAMADHTYETPWMYYTDRIKTLTIADEVTKIGCYAFHNCDFLENVILTENSKLKTISEHAFGITKSLPQFPFPASLTEIQSNAFSESGLTKVDLQKCTQLKKNGYYAFSGCAQLTTVILPESMIDVGEYAFYSCGSLISVTVYNPTPVFIYGNEFPNRANATLYVPAGSKAAYEAAVNWKDFKEIVEMEVPSIATDLNEELRMKNEESAGEVWYDLQGRKLNGEPTKKGAYIVNGKKIIR